MQSWKVNFFNTPPPFDLMTLHYTPVFGCALKYILNVHLNSALQILVYSFFYRLQLQYCPITTVCMIDLFEDPLIEPRT